MERAEARRLQPHYVESFFLEAFQRLGGTVKQREPRRYEITHVPAPVRNRDRLIGIGEPVLPRYERIAFEKTLVAPPGPAAGGLRLPRPSAARCGASTSRWSAIATCCGGARCWSTSATSGREPRVLFFLEHAIQDASVTKSGERRVVSKRLLFVEIDAQGAARHLNYAPYLDYRPLATGEPALDDDPGAAGMRLDQPRS